MANYLIQDSTLTEIANAIREKTGETNSILAGDFATKISSISGGVKCVTGTATADENSYLTIPNIDFQPKLVAVWNIEQEPLSPDLEAGEVCIAVYTGTMLFAYYDDQYGMWISQVLGGNSSEVYISNASYSFDGAQPDQGGYPAIAVSYDSRLKRVVYKLVRDNTQMSGVTFNYAVYG